MFLFRSIAIVLLYFFFNYVYAQQSDAPDDAIRNLNKNLTELHAIVREINHAYESEVSPEIKTSLTQNSNTLQVTSQADLKDGADISAKTLGVVHPGVELPLIGQTGEWFAIDLNKENSSKGINSEKRAAWIPAKNVTLQITEKKHLPPPKKSYRRSTRKIIEKNV